MGAKLVAATANAHVPRVKNRFKNAENKTYIDNQHTLFHAIMNKQKCKISRYHVQIDMF